MSPDGTADMMGRGAITILILIYCFADVSQAVIDQRLVHRPGRPRPGLRDYDDGRELCSGQDPPANRVDTIARVTALRTEMNTANLDAYLIPYHDEHLAGPSEHDKILKYISGFSGSNGFAWILKETTVGNQALWSDGRYWDQADQEMDCNWHLMREGLSGVPTPTEWLMTKLEGVQGTPRVGIDTKRVSISTYEMYKALEPDIDIVDITEELVGKIWDASSDHRPTSPNNEVIVHDETLYAGRTWQNKVADVRAKLVEKQADWLIIHALDETAWLFNLRGYDRDTSPLFYSFALVYKEHKSDPNDGIRLYLKNPDNILTPAVRSHLNTQSNGICPTGTTTCVNVRDYEDIYADIGQLTGVQLWVDPNANYAVFSAILVQNDILDHSPIQLLKSPKNDLERENLRKCHARDSATKIEFLAELEAGVKNGEEWTELSASDRVTKMRARDLLNWGVSFFPISAVGPHAAVIHYRPSNDTDTPITTEEIYLLDSGGQFQDGTTDITRTMHYGQPTEDEIDAYTRVLIASIELATTVWPAGLRGTDIDARAKAPIYENGFDYNHGTGHGIGYFLNVHEGPGRIAMGYNPDHEPLMDGMFFSDEPGYYVTGEFGIRLETDVEIVKADTEHNFNDVDYLTFDMATLVPFEPNLIDYDMLTFKHRQWLNRYNARCVDEMLPMLQTRSNQQAIDWLLARTQHIPDDPQFDIVSATWRLHANYAAMAAAALLTALLAKF